MGKYAIATMADADVQEIEIVNQQGQVLRMAVDDSDNRRLAWSMAIDAWLAAKARKSGRTNTRDAYQTALRQFLDWSPYELWEVTPAVAQQWARALETGEGQEWHGIAIANTRSRKAHHPACTSLPADGYREDFDSLDDALDAGYAVCGRCATKLGMGGGLAPASVNQKLAAMSSLYQFVQRRYSVPTPDGREIALWAADRANPFQTVERAEVDTYGRSTYPSYEEVVEILGACNTENPTGARDFALLYTLVVTCRRCSEILNLKWGDIEASGDGNFKFKYIYKGGKVKWAPLRQEVHAVLVDYLKVARRWIPNNDEYVFLPLDPEKAKRLGVEVQEDTPITNAQANGILKKYGRRVGVDVRKCHIHGLRHAGARKRYQEAKKAGNADLLELSQFLGHSSVAVTQVYSQMVLDDPGDPSGDAAAAAFAPRKKQKRRNVVKEQGSLFE